MPASDFQCHKCSQSFSRKQHLEIHTKYKHPDVEVDSMDKSTLALNIDSVDLNVQQEASQQEEDRPLYQEKEHAEYCHGRNKHKSYIIELKKLTLDLLDNLFNSRNKWQKVADAKKASKSLVVKWNKARNSILSGTAKNKQTTNAGGAREARRRRQIVGEKARNSEKYPLASKLLIREFKLRQAKGSKNSKLWLTTKMEQKIESCCGKEEASKFKASNNKLVSTIQMQIQHFTENENEQKGKCCQ